MTARPDPVPANNEAFGRSRDDRIPLLLAAVVAVMLHVLAMFIPLPRSTQPDYPAPMPERPPVRWIRLTPPDVPHRPPVEPRPAAERIPMILLPDAEDQLPVEEPDPIDENAHRALIVSLDWVLDDVEPPPIVTSGTRGLVLPVGIHRPDPEFPEAARRARRPGRVVLRAIVDMEGRVTELEVLYATQPDLGYSVKAIEAVSRWRYRPGILHDRAVSVLLTVAVEFDLH